MQRNVGKLDQVIRITLGVVILGLGLLFGSWWGLVGLVPLLTGLAGRCPAYSLLGFSTCRLKAGVS